MPLIHLLILAHVYFLFACLHGNASLSFFSSLFSLLIFSLDPLCFQDGCRKRRPNLGFFSCFILYYSIFLFLMCDYLCSVSLGLLYIFVAILLFDFCFY